MTNKTLYNVEYIERELYDYAFYYRWSLDNILEQKMEKTGIFTSSENATEWAMLHRELYPNKYMYRFNEWDEQ